MRVIVGAVALSSVYGLAQHLGWDPFPWAMRDVEEYRALPATYGNPNLAGHALVVALVLCAGLLSDAWQTKRPLAFAVYLVPGAVMAAHLALTHMRSGPVALGVALVFVTITLILLRRVKRPWQAAGVALTACASLLFIAVIAVLLLAPSLNLDSSLQLRLNGYAGAAALFLENPIFGVGPGSYAFYNIPHWSSFEALWYALEHKRNFHAHNEWLEMAAECGIPGLAALIGLFLFSIITFFENPWLAGERHWGLLLSLPAAMVALATDGCFGFNLHAPVSAGLFFLLLALRPARPYYSAPTRKSARRGTVPLCVVTLAAAWCLWSDYGYERQYQQCAGAVDWERGQRDSGTPADDVKRVSSLLESLTESRPLDYRGWVLLGDHALMRGEAKQAADAYGRALWMHPHLPRLHVQRARALILQAQQENVESAVTLASKHADIALALCPELAEAQAMLGWAAYVKMSYPALAPSDADLRVAVERFNHARALGLADDARIDGALAECHGRLGAWEEAAAACQRYVAACPYELERWVRWREAATRAGGTALVQYRQTLLRHFAPSNEGKLPNSPELAVWLASQIAALAQSPAEVYVAKRALSDGLDAKAALTGIWSALLGLAPENSRADTLARLISSFPASRRADISPTILALHDALSAPQVDSLTNAAMALARELATAPGTEDFERASVHAPLVVMLGDALRGSGLPNGAMGPALQALGATQFETGDLRGADENLRAAEAALPAGELAQAWYYHARTLTALGQHEAALAMAKAAQDGAGGVVEYQWQLARCLAAGGHAEAARFSFDALLGILAPDHPYRALVERDRQALVVRESSP
jgi:O-antigen ligase